MAIFYFYLLKGFRDEKNTVDQKIYPANIYIYTHICKYMYIYVYKNIYNIYVYIYIYILYI